MSHQGTRHVCLLGLERPSNTAQPFDLSTPARSFLPAVMDDLSVQIWCVFKGLQHLHSSLYMHLCCPTKPKLPLTRTMKLSQEFISDQKKKKKLSSLCNQPICRDSVGVMESPVLLESNQIHVFVRLYLHDLISIAAISAWQTSWLLPAIVSPTPVWLPSHVSGVWIIFNISFFHYSMFRFRDSICVIWCTAAVFFFFFFQFRDSIPS